jgi:hypothetical protein
MKPTKDSASLLTKSERELVHESYVIPKRGDSWSHLKLRVKLMRKFRDKWRDLAQRQKIERRGRGTEVEWLALPAERSREKAKIFEAALRRYEERLIYLREGEQSAERSVA